LMTGRLGSSRIFLVSLWGHPCSYGADSSSVYGWPFASPPRHRWRGPSPSTPAWWNGAKHQGFIGKINLQIPGILLQVVQMVTIYLFIHPSTHPSVHPSIHLTIYLSIFLSIYLSIYLQYVELGYKLCIKTYKCHV
jgi:hypothetical protein